MPSARAVITLEPEEQRRLIEDQRVVAVASLGPRGWPHVMPLWYVPRSGEVWIYTYAKSQKVRNLERDPRATLLVETGHEYAELRGIQIEAEAEIHREHEEVFDLAKELTHRYSDGLGGRLGVRRRGDLHPPVRAARIGPRRAHRGGVPRR